MGLRVAARQAYNTMQCWIDFLKGFLCTECCEICLVVLSRTPYIPQCTSKSRRSWNIFDCGSYTFEVLWFVLISRLIFRLSVILTSYKTIMLFSHVCMYVVPNHIFLLIVIFLGHQMKSLGEKYASRNLSALHQAAYPETPLFFVRIYLETVSPLSSRFHFTASIFFLKY